MKYKRYPIILLIVLLLAITLIASPVNNVVAQEGEEVIELRTANSKTFWLGGDTYELQTSLGVVHYLDDFGDWQDIDTAIVASDRLNWDWEVVKGSWTLLIAEDTTTALGKDGHWIGFRYAGFGYLDWATKEYVVLGTRNSVTPVVTDNSITWTNIFSGVDLEYVYSPDGFKENLYVSQTTRDWLVANPPSSYGLDNQTTYLVGGLECDWVNAYPAETADGTPINWNNVNEFIDSGVYWRHPLSQEIITALPIGLAIHDDVNQEDWVDLQYRFYEQESTYYLLFGARVLDLNAYPAGTIVLDPTFTEGASSDDCLMYWHDFSQIWIYSTTEWHLRVGYYSEYLHKYGGGLRFTVVTIPQGATINTAYLTFICSVADSSITVKSRITGNDVDDAATWSTLADYQARRGTVVDGANNNYITTAQVAWDSIPAWTAGTSYNSPSIVSVIQEIVDRGGWESGNALALWWDDHDKRSTTLSGRTRRAASWDNATYDPPTLTVTYTACDPEIALDVSSWNVNGGSPVAEDSTYNTGLTWCTITNNSGGAVSITIGGSDMIGGGYTWDLSDDASNGDMIYGMHAGLSGGSYNIVVKETGPYNILVSGLADSGTQDFGLQIYTPTVFDDGNSKSGTVVLTTTCD